MSAPLNLTTVDKQFVSYLHPVKDWAMIELNENQNIL